MGTCISRWWEHDYMCAAVRFSISKLHVLWHCGKPIASQPSVCYAGTGSTVFSSWLEPGLHMRTKGLLLSGQLLYCIKFRPKIIEHWPI